MLLATEIKGKRALTGLHNKILFANQFCLCLHFVQGTWFTVEIKGQLLNRCTKCLLMIYIGNEYQMRKQAGAELCQAQEKLRLAYPALPSKKLRWSSISKDIPLTKKMRSSVIS